jgi:acyl-CoA synthetase (NDP forming)/RimJ/RimL family protein N-acetyltransferase
MTGEGAHVVLRDGATAMVRQAVPADAPAVAAMYRTLSDDERVFRFFGAGVDLDRSARDAVVVDDDSDALLAMAGDRVVGHAQAGRSGPRLAEIAFAVDPEWNGRGLATVLLAHLAQRAQARGIDVFEAVVLPQNHRMAHVFRGSGFPVTVHTEPGELRFEMPTQLTPDAIARFAARDRLAAAAAVGRVLSPESVAVIGASRRDDAVGSVLLGNLVAGGYTGRLYAVHPEAETLCGVPCVPDPEALPEEVDLAIVAVPAASVPDVARACGRRGVHSLLVISTGFAEEGPEGAARERELVDICRQTGMRLVGPGSLGVLNTDPAVRLVATFSATMPPAGRVAMLSHSGALGLTLLDRSAGLGIGVASFVSAGDAEDLDAADLLDRWEEDEHVGVAMLYLERIPDPRRFARTARRVAARKPVIAVKSGRTPAGARVAASRTGALLAMSDVTVDALLRQAGVVRTSSVREFLDVGMLMAVQPPPAGRRVAIVANARGPAVVCADECASRGMDVADGMPVVLPAAAGPADWGAAVAAIADADALIVLQAPPGAGADVDDAAVARAVAESSAVPVALVRLSAYARGSAPEDAAGPVPVFALPEQAARAMGRAVEYGVWRAGSHGAVPALEDVRREEAAAILAAAIAGGPRWLTPEEAAGLLDAWGVPTAIGAPWLPGGVELLVGVTQDPHVGPLLVCGAGGPDAEIERDVAVRLAPVTRAEAHEMVRGLRNFPRLDGWRGAPKADVESLEDLLVRVAALADAHPEVAELDLNPVLVAPAGAVAADARIRVAPTAGSRAWPAIGAVPPA